MIIVAILFLVLCSCETTIVEEGACWEYSFLQNAHFYNEVTKKYGNLKVRAQLVEYRDDTATIKVSFQRNNVDYNNNGFSDKIITITGDSITDPDISAWMKINALSAFFFEEIPINVNCLFETPLTKNYCDVVNLPDGDVVKKIKQNLSYTITKELYYLEAIGVVYYRYYSGGSHSGVEQTYTLVSFNGRPVNAKKYISSE